MVFAALTLGTLTIVGCSSHEDDYEDAAQVATQFIGDYDEWAQDGYSMPVPEQLRTAVTVETLSQLESDGRWYSDGGVQQTGSLIVAEVQVTEETARHARVEATLDSSNIELLADGEPVWISEDSIVRIVLSLERGDEWLVAHINYEDS
ncbi:hypothetical protein AA0Z99_00165 [Agrococcus sp. 1P02AA]|uniref:hypothetical protein n=1 Tax=Agrococcus sp. 1P02AA TaxID=3132259 RepID=UPI0039A64E9F